MVSSSIPLSYGVAAIAAAFVAGLLLGYVSKSRSSRRVVDALTLDLQAVQQQLSAVRTVPAAVPMQLSPGRFTGTELAGLVAAVGTLLGILGGIYGNYQGRVIAAQTEELDLVRKTLRASEQRFVYTLKQWDDLRSNKALTLMKGAAIPVTFLDSAETRGSCAGGESKLVFQGKGPAVLHCGLGKLTIQLGAAAKLFLVPDEP